MGKKVILDCDNTMGLKGCDVDDGLALLYLLGKKGIEICGITTTYGNSDLDTVYANTLLMLKEIGRTDIPVLKGCPDSHTLESGATKYIVETVNSSPGRISVLATGSLTNLYAAYLQDQSIFAKISEIVIMGGITEELIINGKVLAELNFSCDPLATACVLEKGSNIAIITGNNCLKAFFTKTEFAQRLLSSKAVAARYIMEKCWYWFADMRQMFNLDGFYNWDVVAAVYLAEPSFFHNDFRCIKADPQNLQRGLLRTAPPAGEGAGLVNLPVIQDLRSFTDDVYHAWLGVEFKGSGLDRVPVTLFSSFLARNESKNEKIFS